MPEEYWINFFTNKSNEITMLTEVPCIVLQEALEQIDDFDGHTDVWRQVYTYTHSIHVKDGLLAITNLTPMVKEMLEDQRLDRAHNIRIARGDFND